MGCGRCHGTLRGCYWSKGERMTTLIVERLILPSQVDSGKLVSECLLHDVGAGVRECGADDRVSKGREDPGLDFQGFDVTAMWNWKARIVLKSTACL